MTLPCANRKDNMRLYRFVMDLVHGLPWHTAWKMSKYRRRRIR